MFLFYLFTSLVNLKNSYFSFLLFFQMQYPNFFNVFLFIILQPYRKSFFFQITQMLLSDRFLFFTNFKIQRQGVGFFNVISQMFLLFLIVLQSYWIKKILFFSLFERKSLNTPFIYFYCFTMLFLPSYKIKESCCFFVFWLFYMHYSKYCFLFIYFYLFTHI